LGRFYDNLASDLVMPQDGNSVSINTTHLQ
jgi:hypothetical protein